MDFATLHALLERHAKRFKLSAKKQDADELEKEVVLLKDIVNHHLNDPSLVRELVKLRDLLRDASDFHVGDERRKFRHAIEDITTSLNAHIKTCVEGENLVHFAQSTDTYIHDLFLNYLAPDITPNLYTRWERSELSEEAVEKQFHETLRKFNIQHDVDPKKLIKKWKRHLGTLQEKASEVQKALQEAKKSKENTLIEDLTTHLQSLHSQIRRLLHNFQHIGHSLTSYKAHFERESKWRIIDVNSHLYYKRIYFWGHPAQGAWVWVITRKGQLIIGKRDAYFQAGFGSFMPHVTLGQGDSVIGAGELRTRNGVIIAYNAHSGHYFLRQDPQLFSEQSHHVFKRVLTLLGIWFSPKQVSQDIV